MAVVSPASLKTGDPAPEFHDLRGVDGASHSLAEYKSPVLVIFFSCNHCPYVQAYEDRLMALQAAYGERVRFIAINANDAQAYPDDSFENMVKRARERGFNFDYLQDASQAVARAYRATHTPHVFVFDKDRRLAYTGKIDDNVQTPAAVKETYLKNAIDALLAGRAPEPAATFAIGCTIKWKS